MKESNMYNWVSETRNFIGGACPHMCSYCYVKDFKIPALKTKYSGKPRLIESEFKKPLGKGKIIFIGSCFDMFAHEVKFGWLKSILEFCNQFENQYLFQTKNPRRLLNWTSHSYFPTNSILGTTIETTFCSAYAITPTPYLRFQNMMEIKRTTPSQFPRMVSIEPIMDFNLSTMISWIEHIEPLFVSIGADSKKHNLPEPTKEKVEELINELSKFTEVKIKKNLDRILGRGNEI